MTENYAQAREQTLKASHQRDRFQDDTRKLLEDNEKKVAVHEKLRTKIKGMKTVLGLGTRVWAQFLQANPSDQEAINKLQKKLANTVKRVHTHNYLSVKA
eukprot:3140277-Rhodomonas_salina.1